MILILIFLILLFFLFSIFLIYFCFFYQKKNIFNFNIKTFILDKKNKKIIFLNHSNFLKVKILDLNFFLNFYQNDKKLIEWINQKNKINSFLKLEFFKKKIKKIFIFKVTNVEKNFLYFDRYLFKYFVFDQDKISLKLNDFIINYPNFLVNGFVFVFHFFSSNKNYQKIDIIIFLKLKEIVLFYIKNNYIFEKNNELIVFYSKNQNYQKIEILINKIIKFMYFFLKMEGYKDISVTVGVVDSKKINLIEKSINKAEKLAIKAIKSKKDIEIYDFNTINFEDFNFIKKNISRINWCFDFIFDLVNEEKIGLLAYLKINDSNLEIKLNKIFNFLIRNNKKNELFKIIFKELINLVNFEGNLLLFCDYHPNLIDFLTLDNKNNFIFCFDEKIINFYVNNEHLFFLEEIINKIQITKHLICLKLDNLTGESLLMNSKLFQFISKFDYFIIDLNNMLFGWRKVFRNIIEMLLKYDKPIIVKCNDKWYSMDFLIKCGIKFVVNHTILDRKKILKIRKIMKNIN